MKTRKGKQMICNGNRVRVKNTGKYGKVVDMDEQNPNWVAVAFGVSLEWMHCRDLEKVPARPQPWTPDELDARAKRWV